MPNRTERRAEQRRLAKLARKSGTTQTAASLRPSQASEAQIAANRDNATHSTGPVTTAGKAAVSQNRRTHGLNYNAASFTVLPCEDQSDYDRLLHSLEETHKPETATESLLVISMAQHRWLLDRATRLQETCLDPQTGQISDTKLFSLYMRYATTHERAFHKCLAVLLSNRFQEQKSEIGFESEKRRASRHSVDTALQEMELNHRRMLIAYAERPGVIEKTLERREQRLQTAACSAPK